MLEGTWELESLTLPTGQVLKPPEATGVIVVDGDTYVAASYIMASASRKVGSAWEGIFGIREGRFKIVPTRGMRHDSAATPPNVNLVPPTSEGTVAATPDAMTFTRADGGQVTWSSRDRRRVQSEPDGTRIVHVRTSLVPTIPKDLPGR